MQVGEHSGEDERALKNINCWYASIETHVRKFVSSPSALVQTQRRDGVRRFGLQCTTLLEIAGPIPDKQRQHPRFGLVV